MAVVRNVVSCLAVISLLMTAANATSYTVGDAAGWTAGLVDYAAWVSGKSFKVGDELVFNYLPSHDVLEVSESDYNLCVTTSPIKSYTGETTTISLTVVGKSYYICGTPGHCDQGQKLAIETLGSLSPPPPAKPATPPPSPPASPPPEKPSTPPPSPLASPPPAKPATPPPSPTASPPPAKPATPPPSPTASPPSVPTPPPSSPPKAQPPVATPPTGHTPETSPTPPKSESPTSTPKPSAPSPKVAPTAPPSSAYKINHSFSFAFALMMLAAF